MLQVGHLTDAAAIQGFSKICQDKRLGGFSKQADCMSGPLHSYMSISGFALATVRAEIRVQSEGGERQELEWSGVVEEERGADRQGMWIKELCSTLGISNTAANIRLSS